MTIVSDPLRLDQYIVDKQLCPSRAKAQEAIKAGRVRVNGAVSVKPALKVTTGDEVDITPSDHDFVSRGGVKLAFALEHFSIVARDKICLDLGASTGGFTDVLLRQGAARIYAVDVGTGQLHPTIEQHPCVISLERTHAKQLTPTLIPDPVDVFVCDVSFIGLRKVLPYVLPLLTDGAYLVCLVKPQFEMGPEYIGKGGLVNADPEKVSAMVDGIAHWLSHQGARIIGIHQSPIQGGDGNTEYLLAAQMQISAPQQNAPTD